MVFGRNVEQDEMKCPRQEWPLPFLLLTLSPFVIFDSDYALISCPLCKWNTFWNILVKLGRNVVQDSTSLAYSKDNFGFLTFGVISHRFVFEIDFMSALVLEYP